MTQKIAALAAALLIGTAMGGTVLAAGATVPTVTGCLASKDATLIKVKLGDAPASPCSSGQTVVHLSGGDITSVTVGEGLTGGGTNGDITIGLDASFTLPQGCSTGDIVEKTSTGWTCGDDDDTTYSAGTGLDLSAGHVFSLESDNVVVNGESCPSGKYVSGIGSDGHVECTTLPTQAATQIKAYAISTGSFVLGGTEKVLTLDLPAGTFLITATVDYHNLDSDSRSSISCAVPGIPNVLHGTSDADPQDDGTMTLQGSVTFGGGSVFLICTEDDANIDLDWAIIQAIKVDSIN
jgi:hypothetical protein